MYCFFQWSSMKSALLLRKVFLSFFFRERFPSLDLHWYAIFFIYKSMPNWYFSDLMWIVGTINYSHIASSISCEILVNLRSETLSSPYVACSSSNITILDQNRLYWVYMKLFTSRNLFSNLKHLLEKEFIPQRKECTKYIIFSYQFSSWSYGRKIKV